MKEVKGLLIWMTGDSNEMKTVLRRVETWNPPVVTVTLQNGACPSMAREECMDIHSSPPPFSDLCLVSHLTHFM